MPTLTFTFNTGTIPLARIVDAFATAYNYQANIPNPLFGQPVAEGQPAHAATIANTETKAQFARKQVRRYILEIVQAEERKAATATAAAAVAAPDFVD